MAAPLWTAPCLTRRRSSTVSPVIWRGILPVPSSLEKGIITDFAKKARSQLIKEGNFTAARALDFLVCGAINEPRLPADGSIPNQFLCVRCDQKVLATGHKSRTAAITVGASRSVIANGLCVEESAQVSHAKAASGLGFHQGACDTSGPVRKFDHCVGVAGKPARR